LAWEAISNCAWKALVRSYSKGAVGKDVLLLAITISCNPPSHSTFTTSLDRFERSSSACLTKPAGDSVNLLSAGDQAHYSIVFFQDRQLLSLVRIYHFKFEAAALTVSFEHSSEMYRWVQLLL